MGDWMDTFENWWPQPDPETAARLNKKYNGETGFISEPTPALGWEGALPDLPEEEDSTLSEERGRIRESLAEGSGTYCRGCTQWCESHARALDRPRVLPLPWFWVAGAGAKHHEVHRSQAPKAIIASREFPKNRFWGLLEPGSDRGFWNTTTRTIRFMLGLVALPAWVILYNNKVVQWSTEPHT